MGLITLSPILLMASAKVHQTCCCIYNYKQPSYAALAVFTREVTVINMWIGQFACEAFNLVVKRFVKEGRPPGTCQPLYAGSFWVFRNVTFLIGSVGNGYGFPSSHSQYMGYFATFLILHLHFKHKFGTTGYWIVDRALQTSVYLGVVAWTLTVAYSRYG